MSVYVCCVSVCTCALWGVCVYVCECVCTCAYVCEQVYMSVCVRTSMQAK